MNIVLLGATGQVGTDCYEQLLAKGFSVTALSREQADFSKPESVSEALLMLNPQLVINACAYTAVDRAEQEAELADLVNHQSVAVLAKCCQQLSIPLIHLSTDYVFAGDARQPYRESDPVNPLGVYGKTKLAGETAIQAILSEHIILRTSWVFGVHGNNFVKTMLRLGSERDQLRVVDDQYGRPSYVGDIVKAILFFTERYHQKQTLPWGVYHCSSEGETTWHQFAQSIFDEALAYGLLAKKPNVDPIPSSEYPTPAPRPRYSVLNTEKLSFLMGESMPHWKEGLNRIIETIR